MKNTIRSVKGSRDFYPKEMSIRAWLYQVIRQVSELYGYQEFEGPFLERIELYAAKSGEELVKQQSFVFQDRGGDFITLRPELTPTLARMVAQRQRELEFPLRWWSFGPFWRYERPQKGRSREFFQWNIDLIGPESPETDAELIAISAEFFNVAGLSSQQVRILVNDRKLMDVELAELDVAAEMRKAVFHLIDRRERMEPKKWEAYATEVGLSARQVGGLVDLLANSLLWKKSPQLQRLFVILEAIGVRDYVEFNPQIIRGLDYYTGIVFEARDKDKGGRAILGGGRYGNLVNDVGGDPLSGVGFAMGDVMAMLILEKYGLLPSITASPAQVIVTVFDEARLVGSITLAAELRQAGINAFNYPKVAKLPKQFKYADRMGIRVAIIFGPDEEEKGQVTIKDLIHREQYTVDRNSAATRIQQMLAGDKAV